MRPHRLAQLSIPRGVPVQLDKAMGLRSTGQRSRAFTQPEAGPSNLFNGKLSPAEKNRRYIKGLSLVNPQGARIEAAETLSIVAEVPEFDDPATVAVEVVRGALLVVEGLLSSGLSPDEREAKALTGLAAVLAGRIYLRQPDPDDNTGCVIPMMKAA